VASARNNPEELVNVYPDSKLLQTILEAYPHPNQLRRATYSVLVEHHGRNAGPDQIWKKVALVSSPCIVIRHHTNLTRFNRFITLTRMQASMTWSMVLDGERRVELLPRLCSAGLPGKIERGWRL